MSSPGTTSTPPRTGRNGRRSPTPGGYKALDLLMVSFVAVLLISNIASSKILRFGPFTFDGGTLLFPLSYIFGDVLTEVYGYSASRRVIWSGFLAALVMVVTLTVVGWLPPAPGWEHQDAYSAILGQTPRIVVGSLIAYFAGEFSNAYALAKLKLATRGRYLWLRTIGSTVVGQGVDTVLFVLIAFAGALPVGLLLSVVVSNYLFKSGFEALVTPITYQVVNYLKRLEREDYFDWDTDFTPFRVGR